MPATKARKQVRTRRVSEVSKVLKYCCGISLQTLNEEFRRFADQYNVPIEDVQLEIEKHTSYYDEIILDYILCADVPVEE
jgi:Trm5-related predicted tRNA methylase